MKEKKILLILFLAGTIVVAILFMHLQQRKRAQNAAGRGVAYIAKHQRDSGELPVLHCKNKEMQDCTFDSASVASVWMLDALSHIHSKQAQEIVISGTEFVRTQQLDNGLWKYWTKESALYVPTDFDDSAVASLFLKKQNVSFFGNENRFEKNADGIYYTWLDAPEYMKTKEIDPGVNANILAYLNSEDSTVCAYIIDAVKNKKKSYFYPDAASLQFVVSKAYAKGVSCLGETREIIVERVISAQQKDGSFGNALETALAILTLKNFNYTNGSVLRAGVSALLSMQQSDGSWQMSRFYVSGVMIPVMHFGSPELTTAFAVEALHAAAIN